jgi:iron complex outermembrane receptor protein
MLKVEAGARFDSIYTKINELDRQPAGTFLSPNELYQTYFGTSDSVQNETNISGFAKIVSKVSMGRAGNVDFYVLGSSISRTANVTERFIASNGSNPEMRWVGNPKLDPEQHYQVEVGVISKTSKRKFTVSAYYDWVEDYILRDRARSQDGILPDDRASIYRNVEARLIGGEVDFIGSFAKNWRSRVTLSYVWANNESENEPIAQTPPLEGLVSLEYLADKWRLGGQFRAAATQTRADDDPNTGSAQDARETPGYGAVDLYGEYEFVKDVKLQLGVQNLFDQNYSNHLNKPNLFDPDSVQINEPGLSAWIKLAARI